MRLLLRNNLTLLESYVLEGEGQDYSLTFMRKTSYNLRNKGKGHRTSVRKPLSSLMFEVNADEIASLFQ